MIDIVLVTIAVGIIAVTNLYWWRRTRRVTEGLTVSRDHETTPDRPGGARDDDARHRTLESAAAAADCPPEDLPDRVRGLKNTIRTVKTANAALPERWAGYWLTARGLPAIDRDETYAIAVPLPDGELADAKAIAKAALADETGIVIAVAMADDAVAVSVGAALRDEYAADELATDLVDRAGGAGAGGSADFASGGGGDAEALRAAATAIQAQVRETLPD